MFSQSDAGLDETISMTLTELSVFIKKQELDLQLVTEKERDEGERFVLNLDPGPMLVFSFFKKRNP